MDADAGGDLVVQPDCWEAVRLACVSATQWRVGPSGRATGLDYAACQAAAAAAGIDWGGAFEGLLIIEAEILRSQPRDARRSAICRGT